MDKLSYKGDENLTRLVADVSRHAPKEGQADDQAGWRLGGDAHHKE